MRRLIGLLALLVFSFSARAEVLVLVHGYLGSDRSWIDPGVVSVLQQRGHLLAGTYRYSHQGVLLHTLPVKANRPMYTVTLPSMAPINFQTDWLEAYLRDLVDRHPNQPITLVGHSAGGLVARMAVVRNRIPGITHLITIAAPHLGTYRADQALSATKGGLFGPVRRWAVQRRTGNAAYNTLRASRGVLYDFTPPTPGNLLHWLNHQPHPDIRYTSIIRVGTVNMPGDQIVPPHSQDMRLIPALRKRAKSYTSRQGHLLTADDGYTLAVLLDEAL